MGEQRARGRALVLVLALVAAVLTGVGGPRAASASCMGPTLVVQGASSPAAGAAAQAPETTAPTQSPQPPVLVAGSTITVTGQYFMDDCNDTCTCSGGCTGCDCGTPADPWERIDLVLVAGGTRTVLATADAGGEDFSATWTGQVPASAPTGPAVLEAHVQQVPPPLTTLDVDLVAP
jgi:hypothetical protein